MAKTAILKYGDFTQYFVNFSQVKHFLGTVFGNPFDENFYNGDWMLGPNHFCWQPICSIAYSINAYAFYVRPSNLEELDSVLKKIMLNRESLLQYK